MPPPPAGQTTSATSTTPSPPPTLSELKERFKTPLKTREYTPHNSKVHSVAWSCDGQHLASGSFDKTVCLFSLSHDRLNKETTLRGHGDSVDQLTWHPTHPDLLATASGDKTVRLWDARTHACVSVVHTKGENINIDWSPDGQTVAVGNKEDLVTFIDVGQTKKIRREEQFKFEVNEISWSPQNDLFYVTNGQGCLQVHSYPSLDLLHVVPAHPGNLICIEFDPTGRHFAVGSVDALVSLWDVDELACLRTFYRLDWPVRALSFSHDGQMLASASEDTVIDIGHVDTGEKVAGVSVSSPTFTVAWHPKRYLLAYACDDKEKYDRNRDSGNLKVWGFPSEE